MLFMGEEFAAPSPFLFFCDFGDELREAVTQGRRREFARFTRFAQPETQASIPDPNAIETFHRSKLDWNCIQNEAHADWLDYYRTLLELRKEFIVPRLAGMNAYSGRFQVFGAGGLRVDWRLGDGSALRLLSNFSDQVIRTVVPAGMTIFASTAEAAAGMLGPCDVVWTLHVPSPVACARPHCPAPATATFEHPMSINAFRKSSLHPKTLSQATSMGTA